MTGPAIIIAVGLIIGGGLIGGGCQNIGNALMAWAKIEAHRVEQEEKRLNG